MRPSRNCPSSPDFSLLYCQHTFYTHPTVHCHPANLEISPFGCLTGFSSRNPSHCCGLQPREELCSYPDFPPLPRSRRVTSKAPRFQHRFSTFRTKSRYPLLRTLVSFFKAQLLEGIILHFLYVASAIAQVVLYRVIISYLIPFYRSNYDVHSFAYGVALLTASTAGVFGGQIFKTRAYYVMSMAGGEMHTLLASSIALKSLESSTSARRISKREDEVDEEGHHSRWSIGAILNIANTDAERIQLGMRQMNEAWPIFAMGPMVGGLSFWVIGWPGWAALGLMYVLQIPTAFMIRSIKKLRIRINEETHSRVSTVNDLITGIRLLKTMAWEDIYFKFLRDVRHREVELNKSKIKLNSAILSVAGYAVRGPAVLAVALWSINNTIGLEHSAELLTMVRSSSDKPPSGRHHY